MKLVDKDASLFFGNKRLDPEALRLFFYYINERFAVGERRVADPSRHFWSDDPVFRDWKFTNVFRQWDRGTQDFWKFINEHFPKDGSDEDLLFNIVYAREFNWAPTYNFLGAFHKDRPWEPDKVVHSLVQRRNARIKIFTSAHLVRSENGREKIYSVVDILTPVWKKRVQCLNYIKRENSAEKAFQLFTKFRFLGDFMAYQFVLDLMDTPILSKCSDRYSWACLGPGARKGLEYIIPEGIKPAEGLKAMLMLYDMAKNGYVDKRLFKQEYPFTVHEIEFSLCEFSKYWRIAKLGVKGKNRFGKHPSGLLLKKVGRE